MQEQYEKIIIESQAEEPTERADIVVLWRCKMYVLIIVGVALFLLGIMIGFALGVKF